MKKYNIKNYIRYKNDIALAIKRIKDKPWEEYNNREMIKVTIPEGYPTLNGKTRYKLPYYYYLIDANYYH